MAAIKPCAHAGGGRESFDVAEGCVLAACVPCSMSWMRGTRHASLGGVVSDMWGVDVSPVRILEDALAGAAGPDRNECVHRNGGHLAL